jgi:anti-anti-sigma factor
MPEAFPGELGITASEQGTTTTISLRGEWDLAHEPAIRRVINDVLERSPECVVLDLARLSFIDSTGVHAVIGLHKRAEHQGARVVIVPGPRAVQRIFELVGLTEVLPFLPGEDEIQTARRRRSHPGAVGSDGRRH